MLYKTPKTQSRKFLKKGAIVLIIAEGLAFVGSYGVWYKLNTDRDFRKYMHIKFPKILEFYYSLGDKFGAPKGTKLTDFAYWEAEKK